MVNVVFVDDDQFNLEIYEEILKTAFDDIHIHLFEDSKVALEFFNSEKDIDIVFLDITMPQIDGLTLAKFIRDVHNDIPIVFISASDIDEKHIYKSGAIDYIKKPINQNKLINLINIGKRSKENKVQELSDLRYSSMKEIITMLSHQWRQPLTTVVMDLELLKDDFDLGVANKESFNKSYKRMIETIDTLSLTIDKFIETVNFDKKYEEISTIVDNVLDIEKGRIDRDSVEIIKTIDLNTNSLILRDEFTQIILSILENSLDNFEEKETTENKIYIKATEERDSYTITIEDNGGGVEEENLKKILEPYFSSKSKNYKGLGLFITKNSVEKALNGKILLNNIEFKESNSVRKGLQTILQIPKIDTEGNNSF